MKRLSLIFLSVLLASASAFSRPAYPGTARVQQPDGTFVTIRLVGDEYRSFNTTADGYTLTRNERGYYVYAQLDDDGRLAPTSFVARDSAERSPQDLELLQRLGRRVTPRMSEEQTTVMRRNMAARSQALAQRRAPNYDYSKFRGLVILVEYNDCPFTYEDYGEIMDRMINEDNYTGESRTNIGSTPCTGSIRDYFRDNSNGVFLPHFDVVGPVQIDHSMYDARPDGTQESNNYAQLMTDAATAADDLVNFKDYDVNGDGVVDMIYFIFSGMGSHVSGNDARLLWPHQSDLSYFANVRKDRVKLGRYACSTELLDNSWDTILEGIGTMTHEFSHVLGLPDLYDTDNFDDEQCVTPGMWSVMAYGADGNYGRTPVNLSLYERYSLGFATPQVITEPGDYSMGHIGNTNEGFRIDTPVKREFFLLENRQKEKWDEVLPGHGMLIFRVDSTNSWAWTSNCVNDNPKHPYYELIRAKGAQTLNAASVRDPFPGLGRVTSIGNTPTETYPASLLSWAKKECDFALKGIAESNGIISFNAYFAHVLTDIILPDSMTLGYGTFTQLTPTLVPENAGATLTWTSDNTEVATVDDTGLVSAVSEGTANIIVRATDDIADTCVVTVRRLDIIPDIAAFRAMDDGNSAQLTLTDAQVLFVYNKDFYVRDASGSLRISGTDLQAKESDMLNGPLFGRLDYINRMPQLSAVENSTSTTGIDVSTGAEEALPREVHHNDSLSDDMLCDLVVLRGVTLILENKKVFAEVGSQRAQMYNTFGLKNITTPKTNALSGKYFDVTGILTTAVLGDTLTYVISLTKSVIEVDKPDDGPILGDVNVDGTVDVADISSVISVMAGDAEEPMSTRADVNGDGTVDVADISTVISIMAGEI
ncbi:MAG: M6 family metalloprotease domain-containing protein [Prevotella sp.]|nr:M6 family metalloprotease domain-containing protein [Prevotella sp.]